MARSSQFNGKLSSRTSSAPSAKRRSGTQGPRTPRHPPAPGTAPFKAHPFDIPTGLPTIVTINPSVCNSVAATRLTSAIVTPSTSAFRFST